MTSGVALTNEQLARLSELLDASLTLPPSERRAWLDTLPERDRPLVQVLRERLLADALGDRDLALTALLKFLPELRARRARATWWQPWMLVNSGARADPRFKELMREAGLADYWRQSGKWADFCGPVSEDDFECR